VTQPWPTVATQDRILEALSGLQPLAEVFDGDCLDRAPLVTQTLVEAGLPAEDRWLTAWTDQQVVMFCHKLTVVGDWAVDDTARQFDKSLPQRWIASVWVYLARLTSAAGARRAALNPTPLLVFPEEVGS